MGQRKSAPKAAKPKAPAKSKKRGSSAQAERGPHTPEGAGSKPAPATRNSRSLEAPAVKKAPSPRKPPGPGTAKQPAPGHQDNAPVAQKAEQPLRTAQVGGSIPPGGSTPVSTPSDQLNARQRAFVVEYLKDKNATKAYMAVYGVSQATAETAGPRLLGNVRVRTEVDRLEAEQLAQVQEETGITLKRTLEYIARGAFFDPRKFFEPNGELVPITDLDDTSAAALAGFEVTEIAGQGKNAVTRYVSKAKLADRKGYLDMLMKHLGGYKEDNGQQGQAAADVLRSLFLNQLHAGAGRLTVVREPGRPQKGPLG